ncbi:MAG: hypothetical protein NVS4B8_17710 [Herpetosiphon sp.]
MRRVQQLADQTGVLFPVLSDKDADATVAYNVFEDGIALPSTFLIDAAGVIRWAYVGQKPSDRPLIEQMLEHVRGLETAR